LIFGKPRSIYILILLWLLLCTIFFAWGTYSLLLLLDVTSWQDKLPAVLVAMLYFGFLLSTIVWFVFSFLFIIFAYGSFLGKEWVWTTGIIITTIWLAVFALMMASFMLTAWFIPDRFSIGGLSTVVLSMLIDLGIVFYLTRPIVKIHFQGGNSLEIMPTKSENPREIT